MSCNQDCVWVSGCFNDLKRSLHSTVVHKLYMLGLILIAVWPNILHFHLDK